MERVQLAKSLRSLTPDTGPAQQRSAVRKRIDNFFGKGGECIRLKSIVASAITALMVACPVLAFSESADFDDSVPDTDETMTIDTPASNADSNDVAWLSASKDTATQVTAEVDSFYTLTVPEEITLEGTDGTGIKTGTIPVTLAGDIPLKGTVQVKTTATPLQAKGSVDVPMTIATPKVEWNRTEMLGDGTSSDYSVSAVLAPGDWTGTVTFECLVQ